MRALLLIVLLVGCAADLNYPQNPTQLPQEPEFREPTPIYYADCMHGWQVCERQAYLNCKGEYRTVRADRMVLYYSCIPEQ